MLKLILAATAMAADTFSENLKIWRLTEQLSLMAFDFTFDLTEDSEGQLDYFPAQFYELVKSVPKLTNIDASLVQGRWRDNLIPRIQKFNLDPNQADRELPSSIAFDSKEPGFSIDVHSSDTLSMIERDKVFGLIDTIMQVGIYEQRKKAVQLFDQKRSSWLYFAKPNESMCRENLKFIASHLNLLQFESGLHKLINTEALHDTYYKQIRYRLVKTNHSTKLQVSINYVVQAGSKQASFVRSLKLPVDQLTECVICKSSTIMVANDKFVTVYDSKTAGEVQSLQMLVSESVWSYIIELQVAKLTSVRYMSDYSFSKDAMFYHNLKNSDTYPCEVSLQEYFIGALKPYMHELRVLVRNMDTGSKYELQRNQFVSDIQFLRKDEGIADSVISVRVGIPARHEIVVQIGIVKHLQNFMDYPNDPQRGHDIMQMPIQFLYQQGWQQTTSSALLVQTPEPDFSMPFNVNAATNSMLGVFFINMFNSLVKPKRFI